MPKRCWEISSAECSNKGYQCHCINCDRWAECFSYHNGTPCSIYGCPIIVGKVSMLGGMKSE